MNEKTNGISEVENDFSQTQEGGDWSFRADEETYLDRSGESETLTNRLLKSSASVTGIAGQRGTGKSSLALRVLRKCKDENAFTLLIPSPTGLDSREFLVSVFETICVEVVANIDQGFGQSNSLVEHSKAEQKRLGRVNITLISAGTLLLILLSGYILIQILQGNDFGSEFSELFFYISIPLVVVVIILIFLTKYQDSLLRQIKNYRQYPLESSLRKFALEYSEYLHFQTTLSTSTETGLSLPNISSKFREGKSLTTRPMSLPGLTSKCAQFLEKICEVYSRVVICIDELDKIEDPDSLEEMLRGIKGVLGKPKTHFILTVSEDALARFTTQRRVERGILESAFESIVLLKNIDLVVTDHIIGLMCPKSDRGETDETVRKINTELLWLFGNAIPREIKRNALVCFEGNLNPNAALPDEVWNLLIQSRLNDMDSLTLRNGSDNHLTFQFLFCLHKSLKLFRENSNGVKCNYELGREIVLIWMKHFTKWFASPPQGNANPMETNHPLSGVQSEDVIRSILGRAIIEIIIGASAVVYTLTDQHEKSLSYNLIEKLHRIFQVTPTNLEFAWKMMLEYLSDIDIALEQNL